MIAGVVSRTRAQENITRYDGSTTDHWGDRGYDDTPLKWVGNSGEKEKYTEYRRSPETV